MKTQTLFLKSIFLFSILFLSYDSAQGAFLDVEGHQYEESILFVDEKGLVEGYEDGNFLPDNAITRAEFLKILLLTKYQAELISGCNTKAFDDVEFSSWYSSYICFGNIENIVSGYKDNMFRPNKSISYAEASKVIVNTLIGKQNEQKGKDWWSSFDDIIRKNNAYPPSVRDAKKPISRGEMAFMIHKLSTYLPEEKIQETNDGGDTEVTEVTREEIGNGDNGNNNLGDNKNENKNGNSNGEEESSLHSSQNDIFLENNKLGCRIVIEENNPEWKKIKIYAPSEDMKNGKTFLTSEEELCYQLWKKLSE